MEIDIIEEPKAASKRSPWIAGLLSLVSPGLGQVYNGQWQKGAVLYLLAFGLIISAGFSNIAHFFWGAMVFTAVQILLRLYTIIEAAVTARMVAHQPWARYNKWYLHLLVFAAMVVLVYVVPLLEIAGVSSFRIPTPSQEPTLMVGEMAVADMRYYRTNNPDYGDLVMFLSPMGPGYYTSRIMGLPGDTITYVEQVFTFNGKVNKQTEVNKTKLAPTDYFGPEYRPIHHAEPDSLTLAILEETLPNGKVIMVQQLTNYNDGSYAYRTKWVVPEGEVFLTSDNRTNALDSRYDDYGTVPIEMLKGKMLYIVWSKDRDRMGRSLN